VDEDTERRDPSRESYRLTGSLTCIECGARSDERATGWRGYKSDPDGLVPSEVVFYCAYCAIREFG